jgi:hypothetical protein
MVGSETGSPLRGLSANGAQLGTAAPATLIATRTRDHRVKIYDTVDRISMGGIVGITESRSLTLWDREMGRSERSPTHGDGIGISRARHGGRNCADWPK